MLSTPPATAASVSPSRMYWDADTIAWSRYGGGNSIQDYGILWQTGSASANGTFLNGQRLTPYLPHPLHDGDELQIGRIRLQVGLH